MMDENKTSNPIFQQLRVLKSSKLIEEKYLDIFEGFYTSYKETIPTPASDSLFLHFLNLIEHQAKEPTPFEPFHHRLREPIDYYQFGIDVIDPLIDKKNSSLSGTKSLDAIAEQLKRKDNVIFFANHQTEADPQVISCLLQKLYPDLAQETIFVAGERVITDPLAVPFSLGRNLLCIYSKRYIDHPPELKAEKQRHNQRTMELMSELLAEGGKAIYIAPSGGRDRKGESGAFEVAPFDPQSIEMCHLMAKRSGHPTHFYPMALKTYAILPPPENIQLDLGEMRTVRYAPVHLHIDEEVDMQGCIPSTESKQEQRRLRAEYIHNRVVQAYKQFP